MARLPRIDVPGLPQHLVARGNNRAPCFFHDADRHVFLKYLREAASADHCDVHAFVLMSNHVHLLVTGREAGAISRMMQAVGRRYARYVNRAYARTGTLFEGRFRSSLVQTERYFLACMRYIELNPVRGGMVVHPSEYPWSSYRENASGEPSGWIKPHPEYVRLGSEASQRASAYRRLFEEELDAEELAAIRRHVQKDRALGNSGFQQWLEISLDRPVGIVRPGRPGKKR